MIVEANIVGALRMVALVIGVFVLIRFIGQLMNAKRNANEQAADAAEREQIKKSREYTKKNLGKTNIVDKKTGSNDVEDIDFEEVD